MSLASGDKGAGESRFPIPKTKGRRCDTGCQEQFSEQDCERCIVPSNARRILSLTDTCEERILWSIVLI
ncbi:hypothetical protein SCLCIDRAFT_1224574 [Scleroderma citrinum Foug A]|uniref:Uncharacterized protein n=1 Tax=Scleroderma citrinum Foug A TaxID=1036808 RepID=A0A0C3CRX4_9AGAM|nr:hypothetical protein SCLCIDRAFT_1224574 [Scleroderma citrinum Foug A]